MIDLGCTRHATHNCGCPGYPSFQNVLRDCGNNCQTAPRHQRCLRCEAADHIDLHKTRSDRYLERILELQETIWAIQTQLEHINLQLKTIWGEP